MFKYIPASFLYASRVTDEDRSHLDRSYMPFVLEHASQTSELIHHVRTDYHECSVKPWGLFNGTMFRYFRQFACEHLLKAGAYVVTMKTWFNYYPAGGAMSPHSHPDTDFGLVYCLRNTGRKTTRFHTFSHDYDSMESRYPKIESCRFDWDPIPGEYVFFPGSLFHGTQVCDVDGERITLVANFWIKKEHESNDLSLRLEQLGER